MTMPILTSAPIPSAHGPVPDSAAEGNADSTFSDLLSTSRQSIDTQSAGKESSSGPKAEKHKTGGKQAATDTEKPEDDITLPDLALAIATQAASMRGADSARPEAGTAVAAARQPSMADTRIRQADSVKTGLAGPDASLVLGPDGTESDVDNQALGSKTAIAAGLPDGGRTIATTPGQPHQTAAASKKQGNTGIEPGLANGRNTNGRPSATTSLPGTSRQPETSASAAVTATLPGQADGSFSAFNGLAQSGPESAAIAMAGTSTTPLPGPITAGTGPTPGIGLPLQHPQWPQAMGQQFMQLLQTGNGHGTQIAELRLDPPELGPLRISIQLADNVAHAVFVSAHAPVRQALEQALPQLQEQLAQAGLSLGQTSVSDQDSHQAGFSWQQEHAGSRMPSKAAGDSHTLPEGSALPQRAIASNALIDTFA